jgi:hypothetical protein
VLCYALANKGQSVNTVIVGKLLHLRRSPKAKAKLVVLLFTLYYSITPLYIPYRTHLIKILYLFKVTLRLNVYKSDIIVTSPPNNPEKYFSGVYATPIHAIK